MANAAQHPSAVSIYQLIKEYRGRRDFTIVNIQNYGPSEHIVEIELEDGQTRVLDIKMWKRSISGMMG